MLHGGICGSFHNKATTNASALLCVRWQNLGEDSYDMFYTNYCHFWLAIVVSNNQINFINVHSLHLTSTHNNAHWHLTKFNGLLLTTVASRKLNSFTSSLSWKGKSEASTLPHKMGPRTQTTEPKLLIFVSFFSGEVMSYIDANYCIPILFEVCCSVLWATLYIT